MNTVLVDYRLTGGSSTENILLDSNAAPGLQAQQKEVSVSPAAGKKLMSFENKSCSNDFQMVTNSSRSTCAQTL